MKADKTSQALDALRIHPADNICVLTRAFRAGDTVACENEHFTLEDDLVLGAKLAMSDLKAGDKIIKFGEPIGSLTVDVPRGGYIHTHNMKSDYIPTPLRGQMVGDGSSEQQENGHD